MGGHLIKWFQLTDSIYKRGSQNLIWYVKWFLLQVEYSMLDISYDFLVRITDY